MARNLWVREVIELQVGADGAARPTVIPSQPTTAARSPPTTPSGGPVEVTDALGRQVRLDRLHQRIVVVGPASFMVLHALYLFPEAPERLVAFDRKPMTSLDFLRLVDPKVDQKTVWEGTANAEQFAVLRPDLVLVKSSGVDRMSEVLAQVNLVVFYLGLETPSQFAQDLANLGALLGNPARARTIRAFYQSRVDRVGQALAGIAEAQKPRVLLCQCSTRGEQVAVSVPAQAWMQTLQVQGAGGVPVWLEEAEPTNGWRVITLEQIARWNPDQIVVVAYGAGPEDILAKLRADPTWSALDAVKQEHLGVFPADYFSWDMADPRWILGLEWLATRFYPDRLANLDVTEEAYEFFEQMYGMDKAAVEAEIIPKATLGLSQVGHDTFFTLWQAA